jgi:hypothetical protein
MSAAQPIRTASHNRIGSEFLVCSGAVLFQQLDKNRPARAASKMKWDAVESIFARIIP